MLAGIRKRFARRHLDAKNDEDDVKDYMQTFPPPANYIKISQGEIQLVQSRSFNEANESQSHKDKPLKLLEDRVVDLEDALFLLQEKLANSQCKSISFESDFRKQLDSIKFEERKQQQHQQSHPCRDYKTLQTQFERQETLLHTLQQENKSLILRIHQYESCLDDIMRKVINAIDSEDNLREEITILKSRVRLLETQNAALSAISPVKGRDEGYCTMSNGQPQPLNTPLEDLPEESEKWLPKDEPFLAELEDWTMSQEELVVVMPLDDVQHEQQLLPQQQHNAEQHEQQQQQEQLQEKHDTEDDWLWHSNLFENSKVFDSTSLDNDELPQQKIVYSEDDEEIVCSEFTDDFYKLVNIQPTSQHSLYSYVHCATEDDADDDDDDDDDDESHASGAHTSRYNAKLQQSSRIAIEAGHDQVISCSSSSSDDFTSYRKLGESEPAMAIAEENETTTTAIATAKSTTPCKAQKKTQDCKSTMLYLNSEQRSASPKHTICDNDVETLASNCEVEGEHIMHDVTSSVSSWYKSNSWKRVTTPQTAATATKTTTTATATPTTTTKSIIPPNKNEKTKAQSNHGSNAGGAHKVSFGTKIPMCTYQFQAATTTTSATKQQQQQQQQKSKIPPPVPVRRSFRT